MKIILKSYNELSLNELYDVMRLRQEIFIVEQDCPYLDADGKDQSAYHILAYENDKLIGYSRLLPKKISYQDYTSIGRVVTDITHRKHGIGNKIMQISIDTCLELWPKEKIKISAQVYALSFYQKLGFTPVGEEYLEDDIPHMGMVFKEG